MDRNAFNRIVDSASIKTPPAASATFVQIIDGRAVEASRITLTLPASGEDAMSLLIGRVLLGHVGKDVMSLWSMRALDDSKQVRIYQYPSSASWLQFDVVAAVPAVESDASELSTVNEHAMADARVGNDWRTGQGCGCAACRVARHRGYTPPNLIERV